MSKRNDSYSFYFFVAGIAALALVAIVRIGAAISIDRDYAGHLKRAGDANTVQLAEKELELALDYLKRRRLDTPDGRSRGMIPDYTSIVYSTPDEQISFHYDNIKGALDELKEITAKGEGATPLERSNVLIKLRETLLDHAEGKEKVTRPDGLEIYPHNAGIALLTLLGLILAVGAGFNLFTSTK